MRSCTVHTVLLAPCREGVFEVTTSELPAVHYIIGLRQFVNNKVMRKSSQTKIESMDRHKHTNRERELENTHTHKDIQR